MRFRNPHERATVSNPPKNSIKSSLYEDSAATRAVLNSLFTAGLRTPTLAREELGKHAMKSAKEKVKVDSREGGKLQGKIDGEGRKRKGRKGIGKLRLVERDD